VLAQHQMRGFIGSDATVSEISLFEESVPHEKTIEEMETAGVKRIILTIYGQSREQALPMLDLLANINR